jgi:two-component sensor histidine kinase
MTQTPSLVRPCQSHKDVASSRSASVRVGEVASSVASASSEQDQRAPDEHLLLRETNHRWSNDFQLVVGLLALQCRRAANPEVRQALTDTIERVLILLRARIDIHRGQQHSLEMALRKVCEALHVQVELRSISVSLEIRREVHGLSEGQITTLALAVNELTTNAIKHAFEDGKPGSIRISISTNGGREVIVTVDDDGLPLAEAAAQSAGGGIGLVKRLMASIGGVFLTPPLGTKLFELRIPVEDD